MFSPRGAIPALVTPLDKDGELMEQGLRDVLDFTIGNGVHGIFVLGSSGEIFGLSEAQKRRVVEISAEHINGRVPLYVGASEITTRDAIKTARMAQEVGGVDALSVLTPYFLTPSQNELIDHYQAIAASVDLPVIMYNNPGKTMVNLAIPTIMELSRVDNIIGVKESSGNMNFLSEILYARPENFCVLAGRDTLIFSALMSGAEGAIASTANVAPRLVSAIYDAFAAGDYDRSRELQGYLNPLRMVLDRATFPVVLKEGLRMQGIDAGYCFAPAREMTPERRRELQDVITTINALDI